MKHLRKIASILVLTLFVLAPLSQVGLMAQPSPDDLDRGLVAYWRFDEGEGRIAFDQTPFKNDAHLEDVSWVDGLIEFGLNFYGRQGLSAEVVDNDTLDLSKELTLACWICLRAALEEDALQDRFTVFAKPDQSVYGLSVLHDPQEAARNLRLEGTLSLNGEVQSLKGQKIVPTERWVHVALSYDSQTGQTRLYLDGTLDEEGTLGPGLVDTNDQPLFIGSSGDLLNKLLGLDVLPGVLDEGRVYERVLSQDEIRLLANLEELAPNFACNNCYSPQSVANYLANASLEFSILQEQMFRLLFVLENGVENAPFDAPLDEVVDYLLRVGIIPSTFSILPDAEITKGQAALLLVRALEIEIPFLDQLLVSVGVKRAEEAALEIAVREGLLPAGGIDELLVGSDLIDLAFSYLERVLNHPLQRFTVDNINCAARKLDGLGQRFNRPVGDPPPTS